MSEEKMIQIVGKAERMSVRPLTNNCTDGDWNHCSGYQSSGCVSNDPNGCIGRANASAQTLSNYNELSAAIKAFIHPVFKEQTCFTEGRAEHLAKMLSPLNISITAKYDETEKYLGLMDNLTIDVTRNRAATSSPTP